MEMAGKKSSRASKDVRLESSETRQQVEDGHLDKRVFTGPVLQHPTTHLDTGDNSLSLPMFVWLSILVIKLLTDIEQMCTVDLHSYTITIKTTLFNSSQL